MIARRSLAVLTLGAACGGLLDVPEDPFVAPERPHRAGSAWRPAAAPEGLDAGAPPAVLGRSSEESPPLDEH